MSLSIVTFANFGSKENLKTPDIAPVVKEFISHNELSQVICQINAGSNISQVKPAIPTPIYVLMRLLEKLIGKEFSRRTKEKFFDLWASIWLRYSHITLFHGGHFLPLSAKRAKELGSIRLDLVVSAHLMTNASIEKEELTRLGFDPEKGWYTSLAKESPHIADFDDVIVLSDFAKKSYVNSGFPLENIHLAYPDVDLRRFSPKQAKEKEFVVVFLAYTAELKGLHYLLDAWEMLGLTNAKLLLVGGYGLMPAGLQDRYESRIIKNPTIEQIGSVPNPEEILAQSWVLVFPSLTEGFGRVTLEAMACGIPVITTENARGIVEDGKTGFVVPIRDAKALAEKIQYLYDNQEVAKEMGAQARVAVEKKKPFGEAVYEIYQEILKREGKSL